MSQEPKADATEPRFPFKEKDGSHVQSYFSPAGNIELKLGQRARIPARKYPSKERVPVLRAYDKQYAEQDGDVADAMIVDGEVMVVAKRYGTTEVHVIDAESEPAALIYHVTVLPSRAGRLPGLVRGVPVIEDTPKEEGK